MNIWQSLGTLMLSLAIVALPANAQQEPENAQDEQQAVETLQVLVESLNPRSGEIVLEDGLATLTVPEDFYFLNAADAEPFGGLGPVGDAAFGVEIFWRGLRTPMSFRSTSSILCFCVTERANWSGFTTSLSASSSETS